MRFSRFSLIVALKNDLLMPSLGSDPTAEWMQHLIEGPETVMDSISSQLSKLGERVIYRGKYWLFRCWGGWRGTPIR